MSKRWPNESLSQAFNAPKSGCLKADCSELAFKKVLPARAGSPFCKNTKKLQTETTFLQKYVCAAIKSRQQKAPAIKKLQNCKCDKCCRVADRALEAQNAQVTSENQNYDGRLKRKGDEPNGQKSDKCPKDGPMSPYLRPSMLQKVDV